MPLGTGRVGYLVNKSGENIEQILESSGLNEEPHQQCRKAIIQLFNNSKKDHQHLMKL
jgi:hypothetical protein